MRQEILMADLERKMKVKSSDSLDIEIRHYREFLSRTVDIMIDVPAYIKNKMRTCIKDMVVVYQQTGMPPKQISLSKDKNLDRDISAMLLLLNNSIKNYLQERTYKKVLLVAQEATELDSAPFDNSDMLESEINGKSDMQRIDEYVERFKYESEAVILSLLESGMSADEILRNYDLKNPYNSELVKDAMRSNDFEATNIKSNGITYGKGISKSSLLALTLVGQDFAFRAYNKTLNDIWSLDNSIVGWISVRNSSFPCQLCDSEAYIFHPITEQFYSWHPRCVCLCVPITRNMI